MNNKFYIMSESYTNYAEAVRDNNQMIVEKCSACGAIFEKRKSF